MAGVRLQRVDDCTAAFSKGAAMSRHAHVIFRGQGAIGPTPQRTMTVKSVVEEEGRERKRERTRMFNEFRQTVLIS